MKNLQIEGCLSLDECRENISLLAKKVSLDISSTFVNSKRIESLRCLLDLFEKYNRILISEEQNETSTKEV